MPRRPRRPTWQTVQARRAAPPRIAIVAPVADHAALAEAYGWTTIDRLAGMRLATEWYDANAPALLHGDPLNEQRAKQHERALKAVTLGNSEAAIGNTLAAEQAYSTALHLLERVWPKGQPLLDTPVTTLPKSVARVKTVLDHLNAAFAGFARFRASFTEGRDLNAGEITIPLADLRAAAARPPLQVVLSEMTNAAKAASVVAGPQGARLDGDAFLANLPRIAEAVGAWARAEHTKAVRSVPAKTAAPKAAATPRVAAHKNQTIRVLDLGLVLHKFGGKRRTALAALTDGMSVSAYKAALLQQGLGSYAGSAISRAVAASAIRLE